MIVDWPYCDFFCSVVHGKNVSGTFCATHPKDRFSSKGSRHFLPDLSLAKVISTKLVELLVVQNCQVSTNEKFCDSTVDAVVSRIGDRAFI